MADDLAPEVIDELAIRKIFAEELRKITCNGLARKVEGGHDINPRTIAALAMARRLLGLPPAGPSRFIRDHS